jgi:spore germination protein GerM
MARKQQKRRAPFGILFWVAFILLIASIFLYNRDQIAQVLEETKLVEVLRDRVGAGRDDEEGPTIQEAEDPESSEETAPRDRDGDDSDAPTVVNVREPESTPPQDAPDAGDGSERETPEPERSDPADTPNAEPEDSPDTEDQSEPARVTRVRDSNLYFIRVTDDGKIHPHQVARRISYTDSPMTQTIETLISGPTIEELNMGLLNLIPKGTELLSARVRNGTAYLNFNEAFRFNPMGVEGFLAQLQQIVFSSTEFDTVERVQILIDGSEREYLGGEGVYIGEPLSRESFG